jgi:phospholipid/cholesterol/gamma-HCH transport system ATP-binding protein
MKIIEVNNLAVGFNKGIVLSGLNFSVLKDRITVILGESGCGKSTLLKTLIGLIPPLEGTISFAGENIDFGSEKSLQNLYRRIGVLYQNGALLNSLNLYDNIALPLRMTHPGLHDKIEKQLVLASLSQMGLLGNEDKFPAELSGGMRKRASLARALILNPEIIFCDEPSSGLDPITSSGLDALMLEMKSQFNMTLVVVTHELRSIANIADDVIVIKEGGIHFQGPFLGLFEAGDPFITNFFLKEENDDG